MNERKFKGDVRDFQGESLKKMTEWMTRKKWMNEWMKEKKEKYEKEKKYEYA
jgi:hypothetical protein